MSDDLITALSIARQFVPNGTEAAERVDTAMRAALEAQIAAVAPAVDAQPVAIVTETHDSRGKTDLYMIMATSKLRIGDRLYASAQSEGRREALEEAAKVCDQMVSVSAISYETGSACADAIRALSQHQKGEP